MSVPALTSLANERQCLILHPLAQTQARCAQLVHHGPRRPNDVEVLEVLIALDGTPPLMTGMRVDAFFRHDASASASPEK